MSKPKRTQSMAESNVTAVVDHERQTVTYLVNGRPVVKIWPWAERVEVAPEYQSEPIDFGDLNRRPESWGK